MDRAKWLTPLEMVVREMGPTCLLSEEVLLGAFEGALVHLMERASNALSSDEGSEESRRACYEYLAVSEAIVAFATLLRAMEDIEEHDISDASRVS